MWVDSDPQDPQDFGNTAECASIIICQFVILRTVMLVWE